MNTEYKHFEYGEALARALRPVAHTDANEHFYRATELEELEDLNARLSSASGMILVAIDGHNSEFNWKNSDSLMERPQYFFLALRQTASGDTDTIFSAQKECASVAKQIIARMLNDARKKQTNPIQFVDPESFTINGVGPIGGNFYGVILGFNTEVGMNYQIDTAMWL